MGIVALLCAMLLVSLSKYSVEKYRIYKWQQKVDSERPLGYKNPSAASQLTRPHDAPAPDIAAPTGTLHPTPPLPLAPQVDVDTLEGTPGIRVRVGITTATSSKGDASGGKAGRPIGAQIEIGISRGDMHHASSESGSGHEMFPERHNSGEGHGQG